MKNMDEVRKYWSLEYVERACETLDLAEALKYANRAIELDPLNGHAYLARCFVKQKLGFFEDGIKDSREAIRIFRLG